MDRMLHCSTVQLGLQRAVVEMGLFLPMQLMGRGPADSFEDANLDVTALLGRRARPSV